MPGAVASATGPARAELRAERDALVVVLSGEWSLERPQPRVGALFDQSRSKNDAVRTLTFDSHALAGWDSSLLIFLEQCDKYCDDQGIAFDASGLPEQVPRLLALARAVPERTQEHAPPPPSFVTRLGASAIRGYDDLKSSISRNMPKPTR